VVTPAPCFFYVRARMEKDMDDPSPPVTRSPDITPETVRPSPHARRLSDDSASIA